MNLRLLASGVAIAVAGVIGYGIYQLVPLGQPLARSEIIGELNGPALASSSRVALQRYGERQLLIGQRLVSAQDMAALDTAPMLDALVPALSTRQPNPWLVADTRNLIYGGHGTGAFTLLGSISGDAGVSLIGSPLGRELYLITAAERRADPDELPGTWEILQSNDLGKTWALAPDVVLGPPLRHAVFLTSDRVIALERHDGRQRLMVSQDGARHWSATLLDEQVWPDAPAFERGFRDSLAKAGGAGAEDQLAYDWSLYPLDEHRAVGWSWRTRISLDASAKNQVLETRRFEVELQSGASPAFRITQDVPPVPAQAAESSVTRDQAVFETWGDAIYELNKAEQTWHRRAASPTVQGKPSWIDDAWFGPNAWVIKTYADHLFSFNEYTKTYFYTRDQGKTWRPFQIPQDVEIGLLGLDATGDGLLSLAERDGKTVIRRYPLD
ncbi:hypothetical protein [Achromobacter sp. JUb104]|uniref:hypothetical protein n=1 Tax=Achromobacter sp. JUb104 TaxID=2940590 RepID=UPI002166DFD8|nr:hypothetical protein [Achromobacter sp. JUb104]MCS3505507.1 hypothetical protein [Achromobacter sp. JUb104]